jgi:hypothetical protein
MSSAVNYIILIALAIVIAASAALIYVVYQHSVAQTSPSPTKITTTTTFTTPQTTTTTPSQSTTPAASSRVLSVTMYIVTPKVINCSGLGSSLGNRYLYYFNVTVNRTRAEDHVMYHVFKAVAGNDTYPLKDAKVMALEGKFFKGYDMNATQKLGVVNIYLELESPNPLDIEAVAYRSVHNVDVVYRVVKKFYVACVKRVEFRGVYNGSALGPGVLVPTDRQFTVKISLPPGNYRISAPPGVVVTPWEIAGGNVTLAIGFLNQDQAYDPLILNLTKIG